MLTLEQLCKLAESAGIDIFDGLRLPANSPIDRTILINTILVQCGLNIPMYADPFVMSSAITVWSAKNQYTFDHIAKILTADYSPIENKDYTEETTTDRDLKDNTKGTLKKAEKSDISSSNKTEHSGTDTTVDEQTTSAFNADDYQPDNKNTTTFEHGENVKVEGKGKTDRTTDSTSNTDKAVDEVVKVTSHQHGNIGVTSNYELQKSEYTLLGEYNPYTFIAGLFENELTLFVY